MNCKDLSDREIDELVAERVCGWKLEYRTTAHGREKRWVDSVDSEPHQWENLWHPTCDLNAAFQAQEKCIEKVGIKPYANALWLALYPENHNGHHFETITASARIRCEAMLEALRGEEE